MVRARARYRNQALELQQPLALPEGTPVELEIYPAEEPQESEESGWALLGTARLEEAWDNPEDAIYDDWKKLYGV
jgi:hypothetical protein